MKNSLKTRKTAEVKGFQILSINESMLMVHRKQCLPEIIICELLIR
jgi:hypothetical protein